MPARILSGLARGGRPRMGQGGVGGGCRWGKRSGALFYEAIPRSELELAAWEIKIAASYSGRARLGEPC